jgi:dihydrofolate reductase
MRKVMASINMTVEGFCEHTALIADDEIHQQYNQLLKVLTLLSGEE